MAVAVLPGIAQLTIRLERGHTDLSDCETLPESEYGPESFYHRPRFPLSVAQLPGSGHAYESGVSRVARYNARQAWKRGYRHQLIDRADWEDDMHALRSSVPFRQGRDMPAAYMERQAYGSDAWPDQYCKRHLAVVHGVVSPTGRLVGYTQMVQCGEIARVNSILGHNDYLEDSIMWLLFLELVKWHIEECGAGFVLYYTHASGHGGGLRYWKERFGLRPSVVTWA